MALDQVQPRELEELAWILTQMSIAQRRDVTTLDTYAWALCKAGRLDAAKRYSAEPSRSAPLNQASESTQRSSRVCD